MIYIIYSKSSLDKGAKSYLKALKKTIKDKEVNYIDTDEKEAKLSENDAYLLIRPHKREIQLVAELKKADAKDLEYADNFIFQKTTATAVAIMHELKKNVKSLKGKRAILINRSDLIGKSLVIELMKAGVTTLVVTRYTKEDLREEIEKSEILITATGGNIDLKNVNLQGKTVIDLSNDTDYKNAIRHIDTAYVIANRINNIRVNEVLKEIIEKENELLCKCN